MAWLHDLIYRRERVALEGKGERIGTVMEVLATALRGEKLKQVLLDVANQLTAHLGCTRVGIGLAEGASVRVAALSSAAFAALHMQYGIGGQFVIFAIGLTLSWIRMRSGSLWPAIVCHALNNAVALVAMKAIA